MITIPQLTITTLAMTGNNSINNINNETNNNIDNQFQWIKLCKLNIVQKINHIKWKAYYETLPMMRNLIKGGVHVDHIRQICHNENETIFHGWVTCPMMDKICFWSPLT